MIITLTGANVFALKQKLSEIKGDFIKQHGEYGLERYAGEELEIQNLGSLLQGATLFAANRLIIIRDISGNKPVAEKLQEMLKNIPVETHLVLVESAIDKRTVFYKALKKETDFQEFGELDEFAAVKWVSEIVKNQGGQISQNDARLLVRYVGIDQSRLSNEVTKLIAFDSTITEDSITQLVEKNPQDTIFQLLEYALSGNSKQALDVLDNLERAHEDPFQAANMLIWQTHILAVVASGGNLTDNQVAKDMKINPFVIKKTKSLARNLSKQKLHQTINAVSDLDVALKSSGSDPWRVLEHAILTL